LEKPGKEERESMFFPLINHERPAVANKVNTFLQNDLLLNESILRDSMAFNNAIYQQSDSAFQAGYTYITYDVDLNTASAFTLNFTIESMGAYPDGYSKYYNFDLATGKSITSDQILNPEGKKFVLQLLKSERTKLISENLADRKSELSAEDLKYIKSELKECNSLLEIEKFYLRENGIMFYKDHCFPHVARDYEIDLNVYIPYSRVAKYLTPLGKKIVSEIQ
jgi:hypothetical protein